MSFSFEMSQMLPPAPRDCYAVPGRPADPLTVVGWDDMNLKLFYPAALFSTWTIRTGLYPLAVLRSQLQLQKQNTVYRSTLHAYRDIWRHEGFRGLYRGFWITVPQIGCSFIYSTIFEKYMMIYKNKDKLTAGHDKAVIERVTESVKNGKRLGPSVLKALYRTDGFLGFYRGFWASVSVYVPQMLVFWPSYYWLLDRFQEVSPATKRSFLIDQAVAAMIGGSVATVFTNPMELFRVRLQMHRSSYPKTLTTLWRDERTAIFTKGLTPRLITNSIYSGMVIAGYEIVKRLCVKEEHKHRIKW
ncbi:unnamed protein product [Caenorhabditis sp. 36 PRJEB53466]|nr:unnamed protein product [Caenorhabditis sp. 36 PRJEB53466]